MEKVCKNIAVKIAEELNYDNEKTEIIAYGTFAIFHMLLSIALVIIFGILFHVLIEALIISFTGSILRKYSGGVHSSTPVGCAIIGTVICVCLAKISFVINKFLSFKSMLITGALIFIIAYYLIYKLAPVDSLAKPIKKAEKRKRMKKGSILILNFYLVIECTNIFVYIVNGNKNFVVYFVCIYLSIIWQVFTLTSLGNLVFKKIDSFFNLISFYRREDLE